MAGDTLNKIRRMRAGKKFCSKVKLGSGDDNVMVAVVLLPSDVMLDINEMVEERYAPTVQDGVLVKNSKYNDITRNQYYNQLLCFHCMREVDNIEEKIFSTVEEVGSVLTLEDIKRVCEAYNALIVNNSDKLETLKQEDFDELKKFLEVTPLKDLSIVSQVHLMYFLQTLRSEILQTDN
jgi:hypothetical protein